MKISFTFFYIFFIFLLLFSTIIISFNLADVISSEDDNNNNNNTNIDSLSSNNEKSDDIDNDGLTNIEEQNIYKTDALDEDTDNDGLTDGKEVKGWVWASIERQGFCNNFSNTGGDDNIPSDVYDINKICVIQKTNPLSPDTDKDGNDDFFEYNFLLANANDNDQDKDTLIDGLEYGGNAKYNTSFLKYDTDGDDIPDGQEVQLGTNPLDPTDSVSSPRLSQIPPRSTAVNPPMVRPPHFLEEVKGNEPPRVFSQTITISNNRPIEIFLFAADPDGQDQITFYLRSNPVIGKLGSQLLTVDRTTSKVLYIPAPNAVGKDIFTFWAFDGKEFSRDRAIVTINILP